MKSGKRRPSAGNQILCTTPVPMETKFTLHSSVPHWTYSWKLRHKVKDAHTPGFLNQCLHCGGSAKRSHDHHHDTRLPTQHQRERSQPRLGHPRGQQCANGLWCCRELAGPSSRLELCPWWRQWDPTLFLQQLTCPPCALVTNQYAITGSTQQAKNVDWRKDDPEEMALELR